MPNLPTSWRFSRDNLGEYSVRADIQLYPISFQKSFRINFTDSSWRGAEVKQRTRLVAVFILHCWTTNWANALRHCRLCAACLLFPETDNYLKQKHQKQWHNLGSNLDLPFTFKCMKKKCTIELRMRGSSKKGFPSFHLFNLLSATGSHTIQNAFAVGARAVLPDLNRRVWLDFCILCLFLSCPARFGGPVHLGFKLRIGGAPEVWVGCCHLEEAARHFFSRAVP